MNILSTESKTAVIKNGTSEVKLTGTVDFKTKLIRLVLDDGKEYEPNSPVVIGLDVSIASDSEYQAVIDSLVDAQKTIEGVVLFITENFPVHKLSSI